MRGDRRRRACADPLSSKTIARPAAELPAPQVTQPRNLTMLTVDSIASAVRRCTQSSLTDP